MNEQRLIELESKISYQEIAIEKLRQEAYEQQKTITSLEKKLERLMDRVERGYGKNETGPVDKKAAALLGR